jgi:hypothetical protein
MNNEIFFIFCFNTAKETFDFYISNRLWSQYTSTFKSIYTDKIAKKQRVE